MLKRGGGRERNSEHTSEREAAASRNTCKELVRAVVLRGTYARKDQIRKGRKEREGAAAAAATARSVGLYGYTQHSQTNTRTQSTTAQHKLASTNWLHAS